MKLLDGKEIAKKLNQQTKDRISRHEGEITLATVYNESDAGSKMYVSMKHKKAEELGILTKEFPINENDNTQSVVELIEKLNNDNAISGILVQAPLSESIDEKEVFSSISLQKDADGLNPVNLGKLFANSGFFTPPATPSGVMKLLDAYDIDAEGKQVSVVGRSVLFGRPMAALLINANATVTMMHRYTTADQLDTNLKQSDVVIAAVGIPNFIQAHQIKKDAVVIDVGANKLDGKTVGDVDFEKVAPITSYITPVPGGVGPMTIATLLSQVVDLAEQHLN